MTTALLITSLTLEGAAVLAGLLLPGTIARRVAIVLIAAGAALALVLAGIVLAGGAGPRIALSTGLPLGQLQFRIDRLGAFFLAVASVVTIPVVIYAEGKLRHAKGTGGPHLAVMAALVGTMTILLAAADGILFLAAWEAVAWLSYLAVVVDIEDGRAARAAMLMLGVSELGTFGVAASIIALGSSGFGFDSMARAGALVSEPMASLIFIGFVLGFAAKAGLIPLQVWVPEADPAAPGHIAALLSGVVAKMAIYGIIRFSFLLLPNPAAWWGPALLVLGALTAVVGIVWALLQGGLGRILAFSTIENIGLICAALGLAETFRSGGEPILASLALIAALYQVLTHALGKALLFLEAGAVDHATGTRDLARLGGLLRSIPLTSGLTLLGALSMAAVAPFAGYLSEWMILEVFLQGFHLAPFGIRAVIVGAGAMLALTAATAVMVYVRLFAVGFGGMSRTPQAANAREVPWPMLVGGGLLAVALLLVGLLPPLFLGVVDRAASGTVGPSVLNVLIPPVFTDHPGSYQPLVDIGAGLFGGLLPVNGLIVIPAPTLATINSPTYLTLFELALLGLAALAVLAVPRAAPDRRVPVWAGGIARFTPRMQYGPLAYANPVRLIFRPLIRVRRLTGEARAAQGSVEALTFEEELPQPFENWLYRPLLACVERVAAAVKIIQSGDLNQYIAYIFGAILLVLILRLL